MSDRIEGFLEVGLNDANEVVVNHPDLKPDENGVGHIVFSPDQARNLARLLLKHAGEADNNRELAETAARLASPPPPVDRAAQVLVSGAPVPEDWSHTKIKANGQQEDYVVLTPAERAKGFVRPVRMSYRHVGIRPKYPTRDLTEAEKRHPTCDYVKFEVYPESESPRTGRFWTQKQLNSGCNSVTTMSRAIAETFARDPGFYGGSMCATCRAHFPNEEFVWEGTIERVGS